MSELANDDRINIVKHGKVIIKKDQVTMVDYEISGGQDITEIQVVIIQDAIMRLHRRLHELWTG